MSWGICQVIWLTKATWLVLPPSHMFEVDISYLDLINQTLSIWLGIQLRQRYSQIKD